jgi:hypothetical protein
MDETTKLSIRYPCNYESKLSKTEYSVLPYKNTEAF